MRVDNLALGGLPVIDPAVMPAEVRDGTPKERRLYTVALGFERLLVRQLTEQLAEASTSLGDDEHEEGASATLEMLRDQLPATLADALVSSGGIGLAPELYRSLKGIEPAAEDPSTPRSEEMP